MRKRAVSPKAADQLRHALRAASGGIARLMQKLGGEPVLQISLKLCGAVEIQQRPLVLAAQGQQSQPLGHQNVVQIPDFRRQTGHGVKGNREDGAGFDPGQSRCALPHQIFLRHTVTSLLARTANGGSHGTSGTPV